MKTLLFVGLSDLMMLFHSVARLSGSPRSLAGLTSGQQPGEGGAPDE